MILFNKSYADNVSTVKSSPYVPPRWVKEGEIGKLELVIAKFKPKRLPRGYSSGIVACAYIPQYVGEKQKQRSSVYQLLHHVSEAAEVNSTDNKPLILVAGDLNGADTAPLCSNLHSRVLNKESTRGSKLLDVIISNSPDCYSCENRDSLGKSDHDIVIARPPAAAYSTTIPPKRKIMVRTGKIEDTVAQIRTTNWAALGLKTTSNKLFDNRAQARLETQKAFDIVYATILAAQDHHQPLKVSRVKDDKEWMTPEIKRNVRERQQLFYDKTKNVEWKKKSIEIRKLIWKRKKSFNSKYETGDVKWWKVVKKASGPAKQAPDPELASKLNDGFYNVWDGAKQPDISHFIANTPHLSAPKLFTYTTLNEIMSKLKVSAAGPDELTAKLLKNARLELVEVLEPLFNDCIKWSYTPNQWKRANITPIPKVTHPASPADYRPISLTSTLCKVFERVIAKYILGQMNERLKTNKQYGFLPGRSTMDAITQVIEDWSLAKEQHKTVLAIFFDFAKAFDLVDHEVLLNKLRSMQLPDWLVSWIASYLSQRQQRVVIDRKPTEWKSVEAGVVQGSVLGPILFLLFIMDINDVLPSEVNLQKYADDILTYIIGDKALENELPQNIVDAVNNWCVKNKMRLNTTKCKIMVVCNGTVANPPAPIHLNGDVLEPVYSYKYLGVDLNGQLNWNQQWKRVLSKMSSIPYLLKRLRQLGFSQKIRTTVYKSMGLSHIIYSAPLLTSVNSDTKDEISSFHNRILRILNIKPEEAAEHKIQDIHDLIDATCCKLLKRIIAEPEHPLTAKLHRTTRTRSSIGYKPSVAKTKLYANSFVQKYLRFLRDGAANLYTNSNATIATWRQNSTRRIQTVTSTTDAKQAAATANTRAQTDCLICGKSCSKGAGLAAHIRLKHKTI